MRYLLIVLLLLCQSVSAQTYRLGRIHDKDGWTNVRSGATLQSQVKTKVSDGEVVLVVQEQGEFYDVLVLQLSESEPDVFGYVHKSRVTGLSPALGAGWVNDPDGWSNLRAKPSTESAVVAKLTVTDGGFVILKKAADNWYEVVSRKGARGYLHGSRIEWQLPRN